MSTHINIFGPDGSVSLEPYATHADPTHSGSDEQIEAWSAHLGVDASVPGTPTTGSNLQT